MTATFALPVPKLCLKYIVEPLGFIRRRPTKVGLCHSSSICHPFIHAKCIVRTATGAPSLDHSCDKAQPANTIGSIAKILRITRPERWRLCVGSSAALCSTVILLLKPAMLGSVVDVVANGGITHSQERLLLRQAKLFFLYSLGALSKFVEVVSLRVAGERIVSNLRLRILTELLAEDAEVSESWSTGTKLSRLQNDTSDLQNVVTKCLPGVVTGALEAVLGFCIIVRLCPPLSPVVSVTIPITACLALHYGRRTLLLANSQTAALARSADVATEQVSAARVVKSFTRESSCVENYQSTLQSVLECGIDLAYAQGAQNAWNRLVFSLKTFPVLYIGAVYMYLGSFSVGGMFALAIYASAVVSGLGKVSNGLVDLFRASGSISRVLQLLSTNAAVEPVNDGSSVSGRVEARAPVKGGCIEFRNVTFSYRGRPGTPAVRNINCCITAGSSVALFGPSGSGKSTFLSLIQRCYSPTSGVIVLDGKPLKQHCLRSLRENIGFVPQEPMLFRGTIRDNIAFGKQRATDSEIERAAKEAGVTEFTCRLPQGLDTPVFDTHFGFSGGERQRIVIARSLIRRPRLLLLDEPTANLDVASEALVNASLANLIQEGSTTVVLISHKLSQAKLCEKGFVFSRGALVDHGPLHELMSSPLLMQIGACR